jgi:hypothetical protein
VRWLGLSARLEQGTSLTWTHSCKSQTASVPCLPLCRCLSSAVRACLDRGVSHSRLRSCKNDLPPNLRCSRQRGRAPHDSCSGNHTLFENLLYWLSRSGKVTRGHVSTLQMKQWLYRRGARSMRSMGADYVIIAHSTTYARACLCLKRRAIMTSAGGLFSFGLLYKMDCVTIDRLSPEPLPDLPVTAPAL